ncbi:MAG: regulatory protein RecX [Lachnospiraceae bacterium]|nr:regulatory protein RecX [Lachnospiraceae bacterium]
MLVTKIEETSGKKRRIYLNDEPAFLLYYSEISRFHIKENQELPEIIEKEIYSTVLSKRAKLRCMYLLKSMDKTESQLRQKLLKDEYPEEIIEEAIAYVKSYHYVDDARYALHYIEYKKWSRSRQQIKYDLMGKGISTDLIEAAWDETEPVDETLQIRKWADKKHFDPENADRKETQKFFQFLMRKGFLLSDIKKALT